MAFDGRIFGHGNDFAARDAGEVVMVVSEDVAELYLGLPAEPQAVDNAQLFKKCNIAVYSDLIVLVEQRYQLLHRQGRAFLEYCE